MTQEAYYPQTPEQIALEQELTLKAELVEQILQTIKSETLLHKELLDTNALKQKILDILSSFSKQLDFSNILKFIHQSDNNEIFELNLENNSFSMIFDFFHLAYEKNIPARQLGIIIEVKLKEPSI